MPDPRLEANKQTVVTFYDAAYNHKDFEATSEFIGARLIQHDPLLADDRAGFEARIAWFRQNHPTLRVEIKRIFAEGDYVITHVHGVREPGHRGSAIVEIFRLEDGKIVEHWDVIQPLPEPEHVANDNGML